MHPILTDVNEGNMSNEWLKVPRMEDAQVASLQQDSEADAYRELINSGRDTKFEYVTFPSGSSVSSVFDFRYYSDIMLLIPDGWTTADIRYEAAVAITGTYYPVFDRDGTLVSSDMVTGVWIPAPAYMEAGRYLRLRSWGTGSYIDQEDERELILMLKS